LATSNLDHMLCSCTRQCLAVLNASSTRKTTSWPYMAAGLSYSPTVALWCFVARITVLLVFLRNRSSLVESILVAAQQTKRGSFRVIIVDSRPGVEGRQLADTLSAEGIPCTYVLLTAISYIMRVRTSFSRVFPRLVAFRDATMVHSRHCFLRLRELPLFHAVLPFHGNCRR